MYFALVAARRLDSRKAPRLGDTNAELVNVYRAVKSWTGALVGELEALAAARNGDPAAHFAEIRDLDPAQLTSLERAARFIYLNRTAFNGLYRVNRAGKFNVPFGKYERPKIVRRRILEAAAAALDRAELYELPFERLAAQAREGDLVYLDPPYLPRSKTASFTAYQAEGFGLEDHRRLADLAHELADRGAYVLISERDTPEIRDVFAGEPFHLGEVAVRDAIAADGGKRGKRAELLISTYPRPAS